MTTNTVPLAAPAVSRPPARWTVVVAHAIPLLVLPSSIWRILLGSGVAMGVSRASLEAEDMPGWGTVGVVLLSLASEGAALLSLGLVRPWGEVFPRWVPVLHGRTVPRLFVVLLASAGGLVLTALWAYAIFGLHEAELFQGAGWRLLLYVCYSPLLLWGPLLLVLTAAYWVRRSGRGDARLA